MSDERLRKLERAACCGDAAARRGLILNRSRSGLCPWCGEAGAIHSFVAPDGTNYDAACCCPGCFVEHGAAGVGVCPECPGASKHGRPRKVEVFSGEAKSGDAPVLTVFRPPDVATGEVYLPERSRGES